MTQALNLVEKSK